MSDTDTPVSTAIDLQQAATPGLVRRLAVMFYDFLLLIALFTLAAALVVPPAGLLFNAWILDGDPLFLRLFQAYLVAVSLAFFCGFWTRGGQTLGMRAWRVKLVRKDGSPVRLRDALLRYLAALLSWAPLGLGFLWVLVDRQHLAWHDRLSGTRLVMIKKPR